MSTQPPRPSSGSPILIWAARMWDYVMSLRPVAGPGIILRSSRNGTVISLAGVPRTSGGGGASGCAFGSIIAITGSATFTRGIAGGLIVCGDKNFNVPAKGLNLEAAGKWLVSVKLDGISPNTDDDNQIMLPGVETATGSPAWDTKTWTESADYDDTTHPATPAGTGEIVLPVGILTIADGAASLAPVGCGNFTITQCAGSLGFTRA